MVSTQSVWFLSSTNEIRPFITRSPIIQEEEGNIVVVEWSDNHQYKGEIKHFKICGHGEFTWPDLHHYKGEFQADKMHGIGEYTWPESYHRYVGGFQSNRFEGEGTLYGPCKEIYKGAFRNGFPHGEGEMIFPDGIKVYGEWENGAGMLRLEFPNNLSCQCYLSTTGLNKNCLPLDTLVTLLQADFSRFHPSFTKWINMTEDEAVTLLVNIYILIL